MTAKEARNLALKSTKFKEIVVLVEDEIHQAAKEGKFYIKKEIPPNLRKSLQETLEGLGYTCSLYFKDRWSDWPIGLNIYW